MQLSRFLLATLLAGALSAGFGDPAHGNMIVLPNANAAAEGDLGQNTAVQSDPRTLQTVFAGSQLAGVPPGSTITGLAFRLDDSAGAFPVFDLIWVDYAIQLSTSLNAPGSLSLTFAENIGPDVVTVRSGPLATLAGDFPAGGSPNAFGPEIPFSTRFDYNGGDLLITIRHTGNMDTTELLDAQSNGELNQSIAAADAAAAVTTVGLVSGSPVVQLTFTPRAVPEPSSLLLLDLGSVAVLWQAARRSRSGTRASG